MKKTTMTFVAAALLLIICALAASAETITCAECGMSADLGSKFTSRIVQGDKTLYFCDIGDLFSFLNRKKPRADQVEVKDYASGEWMDAHAAFYVRAEKKFSSPMGWGIASFKEKKDAASYGSIMDYKAARKAVR